MAVLLLPWFSDSVHHSRHKKTYRHSIIESEHNKRSKSQRMQTTRHEGQATAIGICIKYYVNEHRR